MNMNPLPALDAPIADLLLLLRQRDLPTALRAALARIMEAGNAEGASLCFAARRPIQLRLGHLPAAALTTIEQWEHSLLSRLEQGPLYAEITSQAALPSGHMLVKMPLSGPDTVVGNVVLLLPPDQQLNEYQFDALRTLCHVTGNLVSLLQDLTLTQQRLERLGLLYEIGQALASELDLQQLLRTTMQLAADVMNAQASSLMLVDPTDSNYLIFEIAHGVKRDQLKRYRMPTTQGIAGWVATHAQTVIANQPDNDPRFNRKVDLRTGFLTRNIICVPMQIKGIVIGVLQVLNKANDEGFDDEDQELLLTLASQGAVAIENARLYRNLREERDRIIQAQEEVRKELARNLHDGTVQILAAISMSLEHARRLIDRKHDPEMVIQELNDIAELNNRAIRESRTLLFELRPVVLETQGLGPALEAYIERLNKDKGKAAEVTLDFPQDMPRLSGKVERTLFAIVQEAVGNARKHAKAVEIAVKGRTQGEYLYMVIQDDGAGFDLDKVQAKYETSGSLGLINMRERAELIDAEWRMASEPGKGTRVTVRVPLAETRPEAI
ncbi:MAG: GAF domain-containing sensor histidine kinase [Ardenticatenales bacterium]|nr:GAF domain-containing sensor histidine kinase [Ardenticatenales bacterium]